jgi:uncharacterized radical SAM superfamily Fe-S cluster-containing enzyme
MGIVRTLLSQSITDTTGFCPDCQTLVPAQIVEHSGKIWLRRRCEVHGEHDALQSRHPRHFRLMETMLEPLPAPTLQHDIERARHLRGLFIDVTEACNLRCPNCLVDAKDTPSGPPASLENTIAQLAKVLPYKPVLYLTGGEPTLLPDLPRWISELTGRGYDVKLLSNGIKLVDFNYTRELYEAGCRWILLQTDTMAPDALVALRGPKSMSRVREQAIDNMVRLGMNIDLACMIDRNFNMGDMGELIRMGFSTPGVRHVSLMPSRRLGRGLLTTDDNLLDEVEMMAAIEEQTDGAVRYRDWLLFFAAMHAVHRTTGDPDFATRRCFLPLPLLGTAERFHPVTRVSGFARDPRNLGAFLKMASRGGRAEAASWSERSLLISIETFREPTTIDVQDAARCSRYYLVDGHVQMACHHNVIDRPQRREAWEREHNERSRPIKVPEHVGRIVAGGVTLASTSMGRRAASAAAGGAARDGVTTTPP